MATVTLSSKHQVTLPVDIVRSLLRPDNREAGCLGKGQKPFAFAGRDHRRHRPGRAM